MALPVVGAVLAGKYEVLRLLGEGGMGAVFEAEHRLTHKRVAIKWLHPDLSPGGAGAARLLREAQAASRIRHSNVLDVYDVEREGDTIFLVMEFLEGETLTRAIARGDLPMHALIALLLPAMRGVAAAHKQGVIHRDIKPDNIFLTHEDDGARVVPKVLDFGISKVEARGRVQASLTRTGSTVGTPLYMSYEQLAGDRALDGRADIYAFGVILYEALTGVLPFDADSLAKLVVKIATESALPPRERRPQIPSALSRTIMRAIARQRDDRPANMEALIRELEPFATEAGFHAPSVQPTEAELAVVPAPLPVDARFLAQATQPSTPATPEAALQARATRAGDDFAPKGAGERTKKPFPFLRPSERHARFEPSSLASSMDLKVPQVRPLRSPLPPRPDSAPRGLRKWLAGAGAVAALAGVAFAVLQPAPPAKPDTSPAPETLRASEPALKPAAQTALPVLPSTRSAETQADDWNREQSVRVTLAAEEVVDARSAEQVATPRSATVTPPRKRQRLISVDSAAAVEPAPSEVDAGDTHAEPARPQRSSAHGTEVAAAISAGMPELNAPRDASTTEAEPNAPSFRVRPPRPQEF